MKLELTDEQEQFRSSGRRFLDRTVPLEEVRRLWDSDEGYEGSWWVKACELGWSGIFAPEEFGGGSVSGCPVTDAVIIAEELGRSIAPGPFVPVSLAVTALSSSESPLLRQAFIPNLVSGTGAASWAFAESDSAWDTTSLSTTVDGSDTEVVVNGRKCYVEAAASADVFVVVGRSGDGLTQVVVPADTGGVRVTPGRSVDMTRRFGRVSFEAVTVARSNVIGEVGRAAAQVEHQIRLARAMQCAEMTGAAGRLFDATVQYAKDRYAFGQPIGAFQALKHRLADMVQRLEFARATSDSLAEAIDGGDEAVERLSLVAKTYVAEACIDIVDDCVQINGGIGVTWEHDAHLFSRRVALERALYGTPEVLKETLADLLGVEAA